MLKFVVILLVFIAAIKAYDFLDFDYNQYLFDEFELLNDDVSNTISRQRRDAELVPAEKKDCGSRRSEWRKDFACCTDNKFDSEYTKQMKEFRRQCAMKLRINNSDIENYDPFDCEKMNRIKQLIICEGECFAHALGVLDEDGKLDREAILKRFSEHFVADSDWKKAAYEGYVDKCLAQVNAKEQEAGQQCSSAPLEFHYCVWGEYVNGCPADLRVNSPKCNKLRERHIHGEGNFLNKHLLHGFLHRSHEQRGHSLEQKEM